MLFTTQSLVQCGDGMLRYQRGDISVLDGLAAARERHQSIVERVQPKSHPYCYRNWPHMCFNVSCNVAFQY